MFNYFSFWEAIKRWLKENYLSMKKVLTLGVVLTTILWTIGIAAFVPVASAATLSAGDLIKASGAAVYFYAADGKRYTFPTESTYKTWYADFSSVKTITDDELAAITLAGNVVVRPGTELVKITTVPKVFAVSPNGKLSWVKTEPAAKALYGDNWNQRIIDIPDGFWVNYIDTGAELNGTAFPEGQLVSPTDSANIYYVGAEGKWNLIKDEAAFTANKWAWGNVVETSIAMVADGTEITAVVSANIDASQGGGGGTGVVVVAAGSLSVALNTTTPAVTTIPTNATAAAANVPFTYVDFTAGSSAVTVTGLKVTRTGLSQNAAFAAIKLFDGDTQIGTSQSLNSSNQAVFNNISFEVPANSTKTLTLAATMTLSAAYTNHILALGIAAASDITTTATLSGLFPVTGNSMTLNSSITIGTATLANGSLGTRNTTNLTVDTDAKDVRFTQVKISGGSGEAVTVKSVTALKNGTAASADITNIRLVNDTTGETLKTVTTLDSSGRAVFSGLNVAIAKGEFVELSVLADMNNSGAGRTIAFDLYDGNAFTISVVGNTYGFGITPTSSGTNFCGGTPWNCTAQTINQGYLTASLSANTPATGNVALGASKVPLLKYNLTAGGEGINVTSTLLTITTGTAELSQITQISIYDKDDKIVAGPQDATTASAGSQNLTFTDAYTVPAGINEYTIYANTASDMSALDTVYVALTVNGITAKGADSGKTTYTTSAGATVPPASVITGKTQTIKGPTLRVITAATPIASTFVVNSQDVDLAYFDLDATAGGEDMKITSLVVTQTAVTPANLLNLELWGDADNTDADNTVAKLGTTSSTATGAATNTFTFQVPLKISKSKISRLTLKGDVIGTSGTNLFKIVSDNATAVGWTTGQTASKTYSGTGQAHTLTASGSLIVTAAAGRAAAAQFVAGATGQSMMSYKFQATNEEVSVTDFYIATTGTAANANIGVVKLYLDGAQVGSLNGYSLDAYGIAHIVLDSGVFTAKKSPSYTTLDIKVDLASKDNLADISTIEIGLGDSDGDDSVLGYNSEFDGEWGANGAAAAGSYLIVATGISSGATVTPANITSTGAAGGTVVASYVNYLYDGIPIVTANTSTPSGTAIAGANKEVFRFDVEAVGDDVSIDELEFCVGGTATNNGNFAAGAGDVTLMSSDLNTTYATLTQALFDAYWTASALGAGVYQPLAPDNAAGSTCFSLGGTAGVTSKTTTMVDWTNSVDPVIAAGTTSTFRLFGDTTGIATNETLQISLKANPTAAYQTTAAGLEWYNTSAGIVDNFTSGSESVAAAEGATLTKNLPIQGGALVY